MEPRDYISEVCARLRSDSILGRTVKQFAAAWIHNTEFKAANFRTDLSRLRRFDDYIIANGVHELSIQLLEGYAVHLHTEGMSDDTIKVTLSRIRAICRLAGVYDIPMGARVRYHWHKRPWQDVLELPRNVELSLKSVVKAYRRLALTRHPDHGGTDEAFIELQDAFETARNLLTLKDND